MTHEHDTPAQVERDIKRNVRITTVLIAAFIIQAVVFGFVAYQRVQAMTDPERLADMGEEYLEENYQELRKIFKEQIKKAAPAIAQEVSVEARQSLPEARAHLEQFLVRQFERGVETGADFTTEQFRELLQNNRETIVKTLQEVKELPKETEQAVLELEKSLEQTLEIDIQKQAKNMLALHRDLNQKLERLTTDQALEPQELLEKRILRIARAIQLREMNRTETAANQ